MRCSHTYSPEATLQPRPIVLRSREGERAKLQTGLARLLQLSVHAGYTPMIGRSAASMMPVVHSLVVSFAPFLKVYRRQRTWGLRASGGSVCSSTTPLTVLLSSASFPDSAKLASGGGFSSWGSASSLLWWFQSRSAWHTHISLPNMMGRREDACYKAVLLRVIESATSSLLPHVAASVAIGQVISVE